MVQVGSSKLATHLTEPPLGAREQRTMLLDQRRDVCLGFLQSRQFRRKLVALPRQFREPSLERVPTQRPPAEAAVRVQQSVH